MGRMHFSFVFNAVQLRLRPAVLRALLLAVVALSCVAAAYDPIAAKVDARILAVADAVQAGASLPRLYALPSRVARPGDVRINDGRIQVYLVPAENVSAPDLLSAAFGLAMKVELVDAESRRIQAWVEAASVRTLASLHEVGRILLPDYAVTRTGSVTSAGDGILRADALRAREGLDGSGVKVGIISDSASMASLNGAFLSGDLPDPSAIMIGANPAGTDEGTAMMEIVHDLAPGAGLAFYGVETDLDMVTAIEWLTSTAGCDVIVDDLGFFFEPYFEDGPIAKKAADVIARGVSYHSAAGNEAAEHYAGTYRPVGVGSVERHDFGGGDTTMKIRIGGGGVASVILQWSEPFGQAGDDYDLVVLGADEATELASSRAVQDGNDDPIEAVQLTNSGSSPVIRNITIERKSGVVDDLRMFVLGATVLEHAVLAGSIFGQPGAAGVVAATAISAFDPGHDTIESFASRGPTRIDFPLPALRAKPDLASIDGVAVSGQSGFPTTFFGTSAAAPHTAALAALLLQGGLTTPAEVRSCLQQGAVDLGAPGADDIFGAGRADALAAFDACVGSNCGDANADGSRNATDALIALKAAIKVEPCELCRCDLDGEGTITADDALAILQSGIGLPVPLMCVAC